MCKANHLPPSCAVVTKSGNLNFLEPSGPVQACNGTALTFYCKLKDETVEHTLWRPHCGTGNSGTAVRQKFSSLTRCVDMAWAVQIRAISLATLRVFQNKRNLCVLNAI